MIIADFFSLGTTSDNVTILRVLLTIKVSYPIHFLNYNVTLSLLPSVKLTLILTNTMPLSIPSADKSFFWTL